MLQNAATVAGSAGPAVRDQRNGVGPRPVVYSPRPSTTARTPGTGVPAATHMRSRRVSLPHGPLNGSSSSGRTTSPGQPSSTTIRCTPGDIRAAAWARSRTSLMSTVESGTTVASNRMRTVVPCASGLRLPDAAQLLRVGAGERGVRVEVLAVELSGVAAAKTLQVGLSGPAHRHVGSGGDENRCGGADSVQAGAGAGGVDVCGELAARPRGTQRLDDAVLPVHRIGVDGQATAVVGDADRPIGVQGDGDGRPAVARFGDLFDRVVHELAQRGVEHVQTEVHRRPQARVLDIVEFGDVGGGVAHCSSFPLGRVGADRNAQGPGADPSGNHRCPRRNSKRPARQLCAALAV